MWLRGRTQWHRQNTECEYTTPGGPGGYEKWRLTQPLSSSASAFELPSGGAESYLVPRIVSPAESKVSPRPAEEMAGRYRSQKGTKRSIAAVRFSVIKATIDS